MYLKTLIFLLIPLLLSAQMKCEAGKCGSDSSMTKEAILTKKINTSKKATVEQLFNVTTTEVKKLSISKKQVNYGYIVAKDSNIIDVTAWFTGYVNTLYANTRYMKVTKGDILATVYSPEVYKAKQDYINALKFNKKRAVKNMVQSAKTKLLLLGVHPDEIRNVRVKQIATQFTNIYAPSSGWLLKKNINKGSYINNKKTLFKIMDLSKVWLEAKIFQNELINLRHFDNFTVEVKGISNIYKAKKELLYPTMNPKVATATLRLTLDNTDGLLKPGMYAKLYASQKSLAKMVVPQSAVIRKNAKWYVFLSTEFKGEYEPISIDLKPLNSRYYEVIKGLKVGDKVVNNALFMMDADAQINSIY